MTGAIRTVLFLTVLSILIPSGLYAHCDTFAGPVLIEAKSALEKGDVTPLLKWVKPEMEESIRTAFDVALRTRRTDGERADRAFSEHFVRIHREGEGAEYTGIKPIGTDLPPAIVAADRALETGTSRELVEILTKDLLRSLQAKYRQTLEKKRFAEMNVAVGREYVAAYVEYVHYVEALSNLMNESGGHHENVGTAGEAGGWGSCARHGK